MSETYDKRLDGERLGKQLEQVRKFMLFAGQWGAYITLEEIREVVRYPEASISARLRDLRRLGYQVDKRRRGNPKLGIWEYAVRKPVPREAQASLFEVHA